MTGISTRKIDVSLQELQEALGRADVNDNGAVTDAIDVAVLVRHGAKDYFVPLHPELNQLAATLLDPQGRPQTLLADPHLTTHLSVVHDGEVRLITQEAIQNLMSLQANNPVTFRAVAMSFPNARFAASGPLLTEIAERRLADGTPLGDCYFMRNGLLSLTHSAPFRTFLERNAPSIAQLLSNDLDHPADVCHTARAFELSSCEPDKWPATYEQLIANAATLIVDFRDNDLPEEMVPRAWFVLARLREGVARKELDGVVFDGDRVVKIDVKRPERVRNLLHYLHEHCHHEKVLSCDPDDRDQIFYHAGLPLEGKTTDDLARSVALFNVFDFLTSNPLQVEFDEAEAADPARLNAKIGRPSVMADMSIPLSYLAAGLFDRAVFSYTLATEVSFLPRGNLDGSIYGTGVGKPFHQGDNEAIRGVVQWDRGNLRMLERYTNEHGATPPLRKPYVATGYRSGAIAALDDIPSDEDGVYLARISGRGVISGGATTAIQLTVSWRGYGMSAMEGGVTPDVLKRRKPSAALLVPGDDDGKPIATDHPPVPPGAEKLPQILYRLSIQHPRGPHGFILGGGKGPPGVQMTDEGHMIAAANRKILENRLGRNHVVSMGGGYGIQSRTGRVELSYHPYTEAAFGNWILSPYVFLPIRQRTLDRPRVSSHLLTGDEEGAQLNLDLEILHLAGGYEILSGKGRLMLEVDGGATAIASLRTFDPRAGVMGKGKAYVAVDIHDVGTLRLGYEARVSTNEYPHDSGRHWEHFAGAVYEQRFNESLFR